ncbi:MAG TPA: PrsW family intramembrane metalloprotease [Micromonosporaceae bacterium]|nr:PrsW family intramembrane metalloprotease [Micromonosporaceae bacterium]
MSHPAGPEPGPLSGSGTQTAGDPQPAPDQPAPGQVSPGQVSPGQVLAAAPRRPRSGLWRVLWMTALVVAIALCGVAVLGYVGWNIGPLALAIGIGAAVIPVPFFIYCFLWLDRYEPEPVKYLALCFAWGACVATGISLFVNTQMAGVFERANLPESLTAVLVAPVIEETTKAVFPLLLLWLRRHSVSGVIDGIVYCGLSAIGFAMVENILYLGGKAYAQGESMGGPLVGAQLVVLTFFLRIVMSGFAHPLFTAMTGIGMGVAARNAHRGVRWLAPITGLIVAMMLHGSWNLMSVVAASTEQPYILLYGYFAVMAPIFFGMVGFALWLRSSEGRLVERVLPEYVRAGWFSPPEVAALSTLGRRFSARRWARRVAGDPGAKAMRAYQFEATRLALLRDGMRRGLRMGGSELQKTLAEEHRLLTAIDAYRRVFSGRDPATPRAVWDGGRYHLTFPDGAVRAIDAPHTPVVPVPVPLAPPPVPYPYR